MNKLYVFETEEEVSEFLINNPVTDDISICSIERGAGSIKRYHYYPFAIVLFSRKPLSNGNVVSYLHNLEKFIKELKKYDMVTDNTKFL